MLVPKLIAFVAAKIGLTNYTKYKAIAKDIFNKIEEDGRLGKLVDSKINIFDNLIKANIPGITDSEIELLRQSIAGEFNKDKPVVIAALENPVQEVPVTPTIKYIATDGTELQPVSTVVVQ